jgi:hypothetical protein
LKELSNVCLADRASRSFAHDNAEKGLGDGVVGFDAAVTAVTAPAISLARTRRDASAARRWQWRRHCVHCMPHLHHRLI